MRLHGSLEIGGRHFVKGDYVSPLSIFPFFLLHMLGFGTSGFFIAYFLPASAVPLLYAHGGLAIGIYLIFYLTIFGKETIKWLFINSTLGIFGVLAEIDFLLNQFGKSIYNFPYYISAIPTLYYILYTFLIRQAFLEFSGATEDETKARRAEQLFVGCSVILHLLAFLANHGF